VVTGAAGTMGAAVVRAFLEDGLKVFALDLKQPQQGEAVVCDITDPAAVERLAKSIGEVDVLVNNAGILSNNKSEATSPDEWRKVLSVNLDGAFYMARAFIPGMKKRRWGRIVNISSGTYRMGRPNFLHYVTTKAGLMGMSRSLARELGPSGITVNTVLPGVVFTEHQKRRLPEEYQRMILAGQCIPEPLPPAALAGPIAFLCSEAAAFVTGQELAVDGGLTHGG